MSGRLLHWRSVWRGGNSIFGTQNVCYYCGQTADTIDHVIPQSTLRMLVALGDEYVTKRVLRQRALKVWACRECNCLASNSLQDSLTERKAYIKERLSFRYRKFLAMPHWSKDELDELGYVLKTHVVASIKAKEFIEQRLAW